MYNRHIKGFDFWKMLEEWNLEDERKHSMRKLAGRKLEDSIKTLPQPSADGDKQLRGINIQTAPKPEEPEDTARPIRTIKLCPKLLR